MNNKTKKKKKNQHKNIDSFPSYEQKVVSQNHSCTGQIRWRQKFRHIEKTPKAKRLKSIKYILAQIRVLWQSYSFSFTKKKKWDSQEKWEIPISLTQYN